MSREENEAQESVVGKKGKKQLFWGFLLVWLEPQSQDSSLYPHNSVFILKREAAGSLKQWYLSARLHNIFPQDFNLIDCENLKYHSQFMLKQTSQNCWVHIFKYYAQHLVFQCT